MIAAMTPAFSDPVWLRSILEHLPGGVALAADSQADGFAFAAARRRAWPLPHAESFISPLSPSGVPAAAGDVSAAGARRFLASLLMPLVLRNVPVQHTAVQALLSAAQHRHVLKKWQRAALDVSGSFDTWLAENFDHKRRKELKRLRARLAEQGKLELRTLRAGEDVMPFADALLALEASGWKGQRGTALATDPKLAEALRQGLIQMHRLGRLRFWMLVLDGKPVAALFALVSGHEAMLGKIAYDEGFSRYSPGVLVLLDATQCLFADEAVRFADGNAIPGHPMIDRIWRDRMECMDVVIAGPGVSSAAFRTVAGWHGTKDASRAVIKRFYLRATGRKTS